MKDLGALSGSREPDPSCTGSGPSGFDPARKAWPLMGYAPGDYMGRCREYGEEFTGAKRAFHCLGCAAALMNAQYSALNRAFRIMVWNEEKGRGVSDRLAMQRMNERINAIAMEARQGGDGTAPSQSDDSAAIAQKDASNG